MSLTLLDVKRIANLAQLDLGEHQAETTLNELNGIFAMVEQMASIDTDGIVPLNHPIDMHIHNLSLRLRDDNVTETNRREDNQRCAPAVQDGLFLVPKVIE